MHNGKLVHVVKGLKDLKTEALGEGNGEALEVIILDELVQVDAEHLEHNEHMTSEHKVVLDTNNVLGVIVITISQGLQNFDFNFALFM